MVNITSRKWFYPLVYFLLIVISFLPLYTERPYDPRNTSEVIFEILQRATLPYAAWGWVFHVLTLAVIGLAVWKPEVGGRAVAAYFGLNYLVIAATQTRAVTPTYGDAVHTGALVAEVLLGLLWLWVAWKRRLVVSFKDVPRWRWLLLPFALLVFWSPMAFDGTRIVPDFNPLLLFTSPDYGLAYCFLTPVFLFLLILAWPQVDTFALRVTAFNGLLYGLFNLSHWAVPERMWLGVMHLPLLVMPIAALWLSAHRASRPCPTRLAWLIELDNPIFRNNSARAIIKHLGLEPGMKVLDFGCGPGRLTIPLAKGVGPTGEVTAFDIQEGMLQRVQAKAQAEGLTNIRFVHGAAGEGTLPHAEYDRALLVTVLGELPDQQGALAEIFDSLKPGGSLSVTEVIADPDFQRRGHVRQLAQAVGFVEQACFGNAISYTIHFRKP